MVRVFKFSRGIAKYKKLTQDLTIGAYQSTEFIRALQMVRILRRGGTSFFLEHSSNEGSTTFLVPCVLEIKAKLSTFKLLCNKFTENNPVLFHELTERDANEVLDYIFSTFKVERILLENINTDSDFYRIFTAALQSRNLKFTEEKTTCVSVPISTYDEWRSSLSKSTRQNLRTAYNRLVSDGLEYSFKEYYGALSWKKLSLILRMNLDREITKNRFNLSPFQYAVRYLKSFSNPRAILLRKRKEAYVSLIYIEDQPAAFCAGFLSNGRFIIPYLKYTDKYARYTPGGLLIDNTINALTKNKAYDLFSFDLCYGNEQYKYTYGGKEYYLSRLTILQDIKN